MCVCAFAALQARQAEMEAARLAREKEEEEAKQVAQQAKKEKEAQKKAIKKERQKLRTTCKVKGPNTKWTYFHYKVVVITNSKSQ